MKDVLAHPSPYTKVEISALALGLAILRADVMVSNCGDGMIVALVLGSMPLFRIILSQGVYRRRELKHLRIPDSVTCQIFNARDDPTRAGNEIYIFLLDPRGY
jgi:hypothetical protein